MLAVMQIGENRPNTRARHRGLHNIVAQDNSDEEMSTLRKPLEKERKRRKEEEKDEARYHARDSD
ncbi:hypothetical protein TWF696_001479 [Orbilia brochopaga]|uniref:Uncharacterized protein n=1 Tax=Orbilia brochopaga TaxID=3140254 RepID=A0AAV9U9K8_9PEZI